MKQEQNKVYIKFPALPQNEKLARMIVAAFMTRMNPTIEEMDDVKTAVSEAVTNCIIHAYEIENAGEKTRIKTLDGTDATDASNRREKMNDIQALSDEVELICEQTGQELKVVILDTGKGIPNVPLAMEPLYTSKPEEDRSGMGFSFMEAFMNHLEVESFPGKGTKVTMIKRIGEKEKPNSERDNSVY